MQEKSWISKLLSGSCPRCGKGKVFSFPIYRIFYFHKMNKMCSHCEVSFEPEPGFYIGAMFVSYALNVGVLLSVGIMLYLLYSPSDWVYISVVSFFVIVFSPFTFRFSRIIFLHSFGGLRETK